MLKGIYSVFGINKKYLDKQVELYQNGNFSKTAKGELIGLVVGLYIFSFFFLMISGFFEIPMFVFTLILVCPLLYLINKGDKTAILVLAFYFLFDKIVTTYLLSNNQTFEGVSLLVSGFITIIFMFYFSKAYFVQKEVDKKLGTYETNMFSTLVYTLVILFVLISFIVIYSGEADNVFVETPERGLQTN